MRNLIFTRFGGFEKEHPTLKNNQRNLEGRINKLNYIKVTNCCSQNKVAQMGKQNYVP